MAVKLSIVYVATATQYDIANDRTVVKVVGVYRTRRQALFATSGYRASIVFIDRVRIE
jgi:hypothetical protein